MNDDTKRPRREHIPARPFCLLPDHIVQVLRNLPADSVDTLAVLGAAGTGGEDHHGVSGFGVVGQQVIDAVAAAGVVIEPLPAVEAVPPAQRQALAAAIGNPDAAVALQQRSEERRVGKECRL